MGPISGLYGAPSTGMDRCRHLCVVGCCDNRYRHCAYPRLSGHSRNPCQTGRDHCRAENARNDVVGLEHETTKNITESVKRLEREAERAARRSYEQ